jgi:hypothetical protein
MGLGVQTEAKARVAREILSFDVGSTQGTGEMTASITVSRDEVIGAAAALSEL